MRYLKNNYATESKAFSAIANSLHNLI